MEYHYKAFISYRHAELDTKVATEVQNRLERYRLPGSIRKSYGQKRIGRIFRDKDELPSTSDLNDNIKNAIRSSEFLICICSPRYIESIWCRKEIEFFLETHEKDHVLTVLAEGDPYEVVPEILCKEMVTVQDEDGNDVTVEAKLEPLSCDYRIERHRARTEELPRLAAVLVGCRYADLRQKMRHRQMRLAGLASAAGAALAGYFIWSYINIQNNYRQALINQSEYLASSAQDALDNNDNLLATQLSLAALPNENSDRPVVPEAVNTLSQAVGAYQAKETLNFRGAASYAAESGNLTAYAVTDDARYLAILSGVGEVDVYDLEADTKLYSLETALIFGEPAENLQCHGTDKLLIYDKYNDDVALVRFSDGEILWHQRFSGYSQDIRSLKAAGSTDLLLFTEKEILVISEEGGEIRQQILIADASGGEAEKVYNLTGYGTDHCKPVSRENGSCSFLCEYRDEEYNDHLTGVLTYYCETGTTVWTPFARPVYEFEAVSHDQNGRILMAYAETKEEYALNEFRSDSYSSRTVLCNTGRDHLVMLEEGSGKVLWENTVEYQGLRETTYSCFEIRTMKGEKDGEKRDVVLAAVSNKIVLYDAADGTLIKEIGISDQIISVDPQQPEENLARINGSKGTQYYARYYEDSYTGLSYMEEEVDDVTFIHARAAVSKVSQFIVRQGSTIRIFKAEQGDDDFQTFSFEQPENGFGRFLSNGKKLLAMDSENLYAYDLETEEKLWQTTLEGEYSFAFEGLSEDETAIYLSSAGIDNGLLKVSMEDGSSEEISLIKSEELSGAGNWDYDCDHLYLGGNYLFFRATNYDAMASYWFRFNMDDGSLLIRAMPYYQDSNESLPYGKEFYMFSEDGSKGVIFINHAGYLADFETGDVTVYEESFPMPQYLAYREEDGAFAVYSEGEEGEAKRELHVYGADGIEKWSVDVLPQKVTALAFYKDDLILCTEKKMLYCYDAERGTQKGLLNAGSQFANGNWRLYDSDDGRLVIDGGTGTILMIDYENWALTGGAYDAIFYLHDMKRILCSQTDDGEKLGYFPFYTVEDLVKKGQKFVGEHTMTEADKAVYGLN